MQVLFWFVALSLLSAATALGVIAWRTARGVRERELARAELLKALSFPGSSVEPVSGPSIPDWSTGFLREEKNAPAADTHEPAAPIFAERAESAAALPRWASLAGVAAAMALGIAVYAAIAGGPESASATTRAAHTTDSTAQVPGKAGTTANPDRPIELIALRHRFERATAFDVSGRVRNPADGRAQGQLMAVVKLIDADGRLLTSQTTPLEQTVLEAGQTSAFSLVFPRVTGKVARYQVEFRARGGDTVPHVDRRAADGGTKAPVS